MEYVRRDEKSDREVYYYTNILTEKIAKFHSERKTGNLGNNRQWLCEQPGTQYYGNVNVIWISQDYNNPKQDQNWIEKQLDQQVDTEMAE